MIPLRDNVPSSMPPYATYGIIAANILIFFWELSWGPNLPRLTGALGFVPVRFLRLLEEGFQNWPVIIIPLFSAIFLHGGWVHLIANIWFLYIFGDNVEDTLGHGRFLLFYLACGAGANLIYLTFASHSDIPIIGASGAVAGVMGAYFALFPGARVLTLVLIIFIPIFLEIPAFFFLGIWFLLQFFYGSMASVSLAASRSNVAWWAHIGGFLIGILFLYFLFPQRVRKTFRHL